MKILIFLLLLGVSFSEQSFFFQRATNANVEPTESAWTSTVDHRFIVNIMKYQVDINGTESSAEWACLGTLIKEDYAVVPADCVNLDYTYRFAIQFVINAPNTNEVGRE